MHMADVLIVPAVAATMYVASSATIAFSVNKVRLEKDTRKIPLMGVMSAFVFAAQMVNFTIPGTGSSGHFGGGLLLSILLGPFAGFLSMVSVLIVQCLLFADGGILALGCNIWNMAFYACFIGYLFIYRPGMKKSLKPRRIIVTSIVASIVSLQLGAFSVVLETLVSGRIMALSFGQFLIWMQPIHLAIGILEGLITAAVVIFISNTRPELLQNEEAVNKVGFKQMLMILSAVVVLIGGGMSLIASNNPDGLEWSILNLTGDGEVKAESEKVKSEQAKSGQAKSEQTKLIDSAAQIQEKTAILPDYAFKGSESKLGTTLSGIIGAIMVAVITLGCFTLFRVFKKKEIRE